MNLIVGPVTAIVIASVQSLGVSAMKRRTPYTVIDVSMPFVCYCIPFFQANDCNAGMEDTLEEIYLSNNLLGDNLSPVFSTRFTTYLYLYLYF